MALKASHLYFEKVISIFKQVQDTQSDGMETAADWIAELFKDEGVLHVFGTGHSHMIGEDLFFRAGGFALVNAILDVRRCMGEARRHGKSIWIGWKAMPALSWIIMIYAEGKSSSFPDQVSTQS